MKEKVGIYGGTFDPIHVGHLLTALFLRDVRKYKKIIFIPCYISPHKVKSKNSNPIHRLNMVKKAIKGVEFFDYSDFEIKQEGVSFTVDSIIQMKKNYPNLELIIGYDNILKFDSWKDPDKIFELTKVIVLKRPTDRNITAGHKYFNEAIYINSPDIEISSSDIRYRVKHGLPIDFYVPDKVKKYIMKNNLYI